MVGMLDDTPPYAKDINNNIKNIQKDGKNDKSSDDKSSSDSNSVDISGTSLPGFITCDQRLNAIIIRDRRENMPFYEEIISKLDVPCEVIKIDVAIVDVNKSSSLIFGINDINAEIPNKSIGFSMVNSDLTPTSGNTPPAIVSKGSVAGHLGIIKNVDINYAIDALEKNSNGQAVSRPSVLTLDNVAAILETDKVHYATVSGTNNSNAYTQSATTKLQVVPHIIPGDVDEDGKRKMKLFVDISDGNFDAAPDNKTTAAVTQHSLNTQSVLYEGQSLVIGGYDSEINQKKDSGIPVLQNLPLVGILFKHTDNSKEVKERIYVISPSVVEIRSDDHKYSRFVQNGQLTAESTLESDNYSLTTKWPEEKHRSKRLKTRTR
jgi:type III secretion protein C